MFGIKRTKMGGTQSTTAYKAGANGMQQGLQTGTNQMTKLMQGTNTQGVNAPQGYYYPYANTDCCGPNQYRNAYYYGVGQPNTTLPVPTPGPTQYGVLTVSTATPICALATPSRGGYQVDLNSLLQGVAQHIPGQTVTMNVLVNGNLTTVKAMLGPQQGLFWIPQNVGQTVLRQVCIPSGTTVIYYSS